MNVRHLAHGMVLLLALGAATARAQAPSWWSARGVLTNSAAADYAPLTLGQLKWMATNAYVELNTSLSGLGGAGTNVQSLVFGFAATNNAQVANVGQLKQVAVAYYDRLIAVGYATNYPWSGSTTDDVDRAVANLGQLKNLFSFDIGTDADGDGLANWRETGTGSYIGPSNTGSSSTNSDSDGDGLSDGVEVSGRTDPNLSDRIAPTIQITASVAPASDEQVP